MKWMKRVVYSGALVVVCVALFFHTCCFVRKHSDMASEIKNIELIEYKNGAVRERIYIFEPEPLDLNLAHIEVAMLVGHSKCNVITGQVDSNAYYYSWVRLNDLMSKEGVMCEDKATGLDMLKICLADKCYWLRTGVSATENDVALMAKIVSIYSNTMSGMKTNSRNEGLHYSL